MKIFFSILIVLFFLFTACEKENQATTPDCSTVSAKYSTDVKPLFTSCLTSNCHAANAPYGDLTTYSAVKKMVDNGSIMARVVKEGSMPPTGPLSADSKAKIQCWMNAGALNN